MKCLLSYYRGSKTQILQDDDYIITGYGRLMTIITHTQAEADYLQGLALMMGESITVRVNNADGLQLYCWVTIPELELPL